MAVLLARMNAELPTTHGRAEGKETLGIIGLGLLGSALAERALAAGVTVLGVDLEVSRRAQLDHSGGQSLASAREVAVACRRILLVLPE